MLKIICGVIASTMPLWLASAAMAEDHNKHKTEDHDAHAGHGQSIGTALELDQGKKWLTDQTMRAGMDKIHKLVLEAMPKAKDKAAPDAADKATADGIKTELDKIIATCKLSPKADANFHVILADLLGGISALQSSDSKIKPSAAYRQMAKGLHNYDNFFDHPGFLKAHGTK